jgi:hypothetical protein
MQNMEGDRDSDIRLQKCTVCLTAELQGQIYKKKGKEKTKNPSSSSTA